MREDGRVGPAKQIDGRKVFDIRMLDEAFDALPDERLDCDDDLPNCGLTIGSVGHAPTIAPGCVEDTDRHGNVRVYYRAKRRAEDTASQHALDS